VVSDKDLQGRIYREHQEYWQSVAGQRHGKSFLLSSHLRGQFLKVNISQARQVTGLLTGHCHLKDHRFKLGVINDLICGRCHMETETASHILCECVSIANAWANILWYLMIIMRFCSARYYTLLEVWDYWLDQEMVRVQVSPCAPTYLTLIQGDSNRMGCANQVVCVGGWEMHITFWRETYPDIGNVILNAPCTNGLWWSGLDSAG
jgi:hypothetical protein